MSVSLTDNQLSAALIGIYAYDTGCTDSGIHDEFLRQTCRERLRELTTQKVEGYLMDASVLFLSRMMRESFLSEESLKFGYSLGEVKEFVGWLSERMGYDL